MLDVGEITRAVASNSIVLPMQTKSNEEARQLLCRRYKSHAMQVAGWSTPYPQELARR